MTLSSPDALLVTGLYRSGTTLVEKLLHNHPNVCIGSQPFPILFFQVKEAFYREIGIERRYPLDHLFRESGYSAARFHDFLDTHEFSAADVDMLFDRLAGFHKGLWTPEILEYRGRIRPGKFLDLFDQLRLCLLDIFRKPDLVYLGAKEVLCEEYLPYLLERGVRAAVSVRDPRSVLASLNFGRHDSFTGAIRPTLYTVRAWRKSVAFILAHARHPNFAWVRFEDLVDDVTGRMNGIYERFGLPALPPEAFTGNIQDQRGGDWKGNSSFGDLAGIDRGRKKYEAVLPEAAIHYIEACCLPELQVLGYPLHDGGAFREDAIRDFREPFDVGHEMFPPDYSQRSDHVEEEVRRYRLLENGRISDDDARSWFLGVDVYRLLAETVSGSARTEP